MVKSVLDDNITYSENTNIDEGDIGYDAIQFEVELFPEIEANIALGNVRYTFADKGILFIPFYLVKNNEIYGCGKPFKLFWNRNPTNNVVQFYTEICDYI